MPPGRITSRGSAYDVLMQIEITEDAQKLLQKKLLKKLLQK